MRYFDLVALDAGTPQDNTALTSRGRTSPAASATPGDEVWTVGAFDMNPVVGGAEVAPVAWPEEEAGGGGPVPAAAKRPWIPVLEAVELAEPERSPPRVEPRSDIGRGDLQAPAAAGFESTQLPARHDERVQHAKAPAPDVALHSLSAPQWEDAKFRSAPLATRVPAQNADAERSPVERVRHDAADSGPDAPQVAPVRIVSERPGAGAALPDPSLDSAPPAFGELAARPPDRAEATVRLTGAANAGAPSGPAARDSRPVATPGVAHAPTASTSRTLAMSGTAAAGETPRIDAVAAAAGPSADHARAPFPVAARVSPFLEATPRDLGSAPVPRPKSNDAPRRISAVVEEAAANPLGEREHEQSSQLARPDLSTEPERRLPSPSGRRKEPAHRPPPLLVIGRLDVIVEAPPVSARPPEVAPAAGVSDPSSALYLRRL